MYLKELFNKYAEWKIIYHFLKHPDLKTHVNGLSKTLKVSKGTASTTLRKAHKAKLLRKEEIANVHLYSLNKNNKTVKKLIKLVEET